jgi:hypothetical protein
MSHKHAAMDGHPVETCHCTTRRPFICCIGAQLQNSPPAICQYQDRHPASLCHRAAVNSVHASAETPSPNTSPLATINMLVL